MSIQKIGFRAAPSKKERAGYFLEFWNEFSVSERIKVNGLWSPDNEAPFLDAAAKAWDKRFKRGTVIWLSEDSDMTYGPYCFRFTPPAGTIFSRSVAGPYWLAFVPMRVIPPKYFELL